MRSRLSVPPLLSAINDTAVASVAQPTCRLLVRPLFLRAPVTTTAGNFVCASPRHTFFRSAVTSRVLVPPPGPAATSAEPRPRQPPLGPPTSPLWTVAFPARPPVPPPSPNRKSKETPLHSESAVGQRRPR
jgi:hypothetical protein